MSRSTLPIDLLVHALALFFRMHAPESNPEGTGANAGYRLLQLCRLTPAQKKQATEHMQHRVFELRADVKGIAARAAHSAFAATLLEHAIRPCMRFVDPAIAEVPRPLVIDTGPQRRIGRDHILMSLLAAVLRRTARPIRVALFCLNLRSCDVHRALLMGMARSTCIKCNGERVRFRDGSQVTFHSIHNMNGLRGISADLILANDCQSISGDFIFNTLVPLMCAGNPSVVLMGQGELMDGFLSASTQLLAHFDLAHALIPPPVEDVLQ